MIDTAHDFLNALRVLHSLDFDDLVNAGVMRADAHRAWETFRANPTVWVLRADDATAEKLWVMVKRRMRPRTGLHPRLAMDAAS